MGQSHCQCADQYLRATRAPRSALLEQELLAEFELPDKENYFQPFQSSRYFCPESAKLPAKFTDLFMVLRNTSRKYEDIFFPPEQWTSLHSPDRCRRISEGLPKSGSPLKSSCRIVLEYIDRKYPTLSARLAPIYMEEAGFAICRLYIGGQPRQILVDDRIPIEGMDTSSSAGVLLLEKAFAKALGSYDYLRDFLIGDIFSEITGIPTVPSESEDQQQHISFQSFKDALNCDQLLYESQRDRENSQTLGYRDNFEVHSISISSKNCLIKVQNPSKQVVSLRVVQMGVAYREAANSCYPFVFLELFRDKDGQMQRVSSFRREGNNLYLGAPFIDLPAGAYYASVRQLERQELLSFVAYCKTPLRMAETYDAKLITTIPFQSLRTEYSLGSLNYSEILPGIRGILKMMEHKIAVMLDRSYPSHALAPLLSSVSLEVEGEEKKKNWKAYPMKELMGKWFVVFYWATEVRSLEQLVRAIDI